MSTQVEFWFREIWNRTGHCLNLQTGSPDFPFVQTWLDLLLQPLLLCVHLLLLLRLILSVNLHVLTKDTKEKLVWNNRQEEVLCSSEALDSSSGYSVHLFVSTKNCHLLTVTAAVTEKLMMMKARMLMMTTGDIEQYLAIVINLHQLFNHKFPKSQTCHLAKTQLSRWLCFKPIKSCIDH